MASKIRFYLEQSAVELEELHHKGIFGRPELQQISKRRTDFEHKINSPNARPQDYLRYAQYEINLDKLRKIRTKRINEKNGDYDDDENAREQTIGEYGGTRRALFIYERGTRRFAGNIEIWMSYLGYAKKINAVQVISKLFSKLLKLHPTKPDLWILAAKYEAEDNGAMISARNVMQRALRMNGDSLKLWKEYAKLELIYVAKILARRKLLGLKDMVTNHSNVVTDPQTQHEHDNKPTDGDMIVLPEISAEEIEGELKNLPDTDISMLGNPQTNPALRGDIALVIFDAAMTKIATISEAKQLAFVHEILEIMDAFTSLDRRYLCGHVIGFADERFGSADTGVLKITLPLRHVVYTSPEFPDRVREMMQLYAKNETKPKDLNHRLKEYIDAQYLTKEDLEENLRLVFKAFSDRLN